MERFIEAAMRSLVTASDPPVPEDYIVFLRAKVTSYAEKLRRTPDHPPYAWMIERAIQGLNEKRGSTEESISEFIKKENNDLPWAHFTMLKHHLERLCQSGQLVMTSGARYMQATSVSAVKESTKNRKKSGKRKRGGWQKGRKRLARGGGEDKEIPTSEVIDAVEEGLEEEESSQVNRNTVVPNELPMKTVPAGFAVGDDVKKVPFFFVYQRRPRPTVSEKVKSDSPPVVDISPLSYEDLQDQKCPPKPPLTGRCLGKRRPGRPPKREGVVISGSQAKSSIKEEPNGFEHGIGYRTRGRLRDAAKNYC